jgi:hypothetical protein
MASWEELENLLREASNLLTRLRRRSSILAWTRKGTSVGSAKQLFSPRRSEMRFTFSAKTSCQSI